MPTQVNDHFNLQFNALDLRLLESGLARLDSAWQYDGVCSPFNRLYFVREGEGLVLWEGREIRLLPGHVYLLPAGVTYGFRCPRAMYKLYFHFTATLQNGFDLFAGCDGCIEQAMSPQELERLLELYQAQGLADFMEARQYFDRVVAGFVRLTHSPEATPRQYSALLRQVFPLIRENLTLKTDAAALSSQLSVSKSVLSKRFREETGLPLGKYIDGLLFQKAQRLLLTTDATIGQIAEQLGFCDQYYFSRYFKLRQQEPPSRYRKRLGGMI